jgi:imidazolonepropionase-like amidohydrolase
MAYRFGGNLVERVIKKGKLVVDRTPETVV